MTPAEFDTRRRLLGLSVQAAADYCGVNRRTIERWINGDSEMAEEAIERLQELEDRMSAAAEQAVELAREKQAGAVELLRYRSQQAVDASPRAAGLPLGSHAILIGWVADALEAEGVETEIVWGD